LISPVPPLIVVQEMKRSDVSEFRQNARAILRYARIWLCSALAVAVTMFFIHSAPALHLVVMAVLGFLWGGLLAFSWRMEKMILQLLVIVFVAGSSTLAERLFQLTSQFQNVQGLMLAFASAGVLFAVFQRRIAVFARLEPK
jgi:dolichyl-phosphate-mannose--protein O-mannosyl transferase